MSEKTIKHEIEGFEKINDFILPMEFKKHLINFENYKLTKQLFKFEHNGQSYYTCVNRFFAFDDTSERPYTVRKWYNRFKDEFKCYLPFGNDHGGGNYIISTCEKDYGKVFFYAMEDHIEVGKIMLANSFEGFINNLQEEE